MKLWMKALVWLGLGGGIGFFAGYRVGLIRSDKGDLDDLKELTERVTNAEKRNDLIEQNYAADVRGVERKYDSEIRRINEKHRLEMDEMRARYEAALDAQREYLGGKDDEVLSEEPIETNIEDDADDDVMEEEPEMPEDILEDEIPQLHPEDLRPFAISASEYLQNSSDYDQVQLDYYTEDCVIFDPLREEKWTHPEQLLGLGWKTMFIGGDKPVREAYVQNDTMGVLYKITRIDDSFERLYEEE